MRWRKAIPRSHVLGALALGAVMPWLPPGAVGCGYHDNVSLARGILNWTYPDSLHVIGAIATAVADGRLPADGPRAALGLAGYHGTVRALDRHAQQLRLASGEMPHMVFSLLLIEPMLWTRFESEGDDMRARVHAFGPQAGDLVVISGENVIREIANNHVTVGEVYRHGLMRLYGTQEQKSLFLHRYDQVGRQRS
jgi:hypothetical protein